MIMIVAMVPALQVYKKKDFKLANVIKMILQIKYRILHYIKQKTEACKKCQEMTKATCIP